MNLRFPVSALSGRDGQLTRLPIVLVVVSLVAWLAHAVALQRGLDRLHELASQRLEVEAARLEGQLARFDYFPSLLETSPEVLQLLERPQDTVLQLAVSRYLHTLNALAGADNLYVLHASGLALAAADADRPGTPVGQNLSYRPYVREAVARGRGRFYGVGITSTQPGYYLSYALPAGRTAVLGIATVKVGLGAFEAEWRDLPGDVLVLDDNGVVILTTRDDWRYRPLSTLPEKVRDEARIERRYAGADLRPLDWRARRLSQGAERVRLDGRTYLAIERAVNQGRWRMVLLDDEATARATARNIAVMSGLAAAVLLLAVTVVAQRQRALRQRLANRVALQAAHDSLEVKVRERTAELQAAQDELIHAGKLALLGQLSAGMVHELNQPLAALQTLSDNADTLIERGRLDEARGNLARIGRLVGRLARLTGQLKVFAHKAQEPVSVVPVRTAVDETLALLAPRLRQAGIEVSVNVEPAGLAVACNDARLEQVLNNLINNAVDALECAPERRIEVRAVRADDLAHIVISNTGPCIDPDILPRLFEPFVSSKPAGKGLGLGLMISAHIVRAFRGSLRARNLDPRGAEFTVTLPVAQP